MKTAKKLWALLLAAMMIMMVPVSASAAQKFVPVAGYQQYWNGSKWVKDFDFTAKYKSSGNITSFIKEYSSGYSETRTYKWKNNRVVENTYYTSKGYTDKAVRSYKNNLLKKSEFTASSKDYITTRKYSWKKRTAKVTLSYSKKYSSSTYTIKVNKKGRRSYEYVPGNSPVTSSWKYYSNGNLKSYVHKSSSGTTSTYFNELGYKESNGGIYYTYTMDKKKNRPKKVEWTSDKRKYRMVYTKYKKVSAIKNCDAWGYPVVLGGLLSLSR